MAPKYFLGHVRRFLAHSLGDAEYLSLTTLKGKKITVFTFHNKEDEPYCVLLYF